MGKNATKSLLNYSKLETFIDNYPPYNLYPEQETEDFSRLLTGIIDVLGKKGARYVLFRGGILGENAMAKETHCCAVGDDMCRLIMYRPKA